MPQARAMTIRAYQQYMEQKVAESHMLWRSVNKLILHVLRSKRSREWMVKRLRKLAGPKLPSEPVCVGNLRSAARSLELRREICVI